jgi:hypothetical protein
MRYPKAPHYTFNFTLAHNVPISGYIKIQFDNGYTLSGAAVATSGYALTETGSNYIMLRTGSALDRGDFHPA